MYDWILHIPPHVQQIMATIRERGHIVYVVGGAVRDLLLGQKPKDFDLVTSAKPDEISQMFAKTLDIGKHFGISMIVTEEGTTEVATFRADGDYGDSRHPDSVRYASPQEDALRRDFTINGLFWDPESKEILDYVEGLKDIADRRIRAIGDPEKRFNEDALRILRALRFLSQLAPHHFRLELTTLQAIAKLCPNLIKVSRERITAEMNFILASRVPSLALQHIRDIGLWWNWFGDIELGVPGLAMLDHFTVATKISSRWATLVIEAENFASVEKSLARFLMSKGAVDNIKDIYLAREIILKSQSLGLADLKEFLAGPNADEIIDFYLNYTKYSEAAQHKSLRAAVDYCERRRSEFIVKGTLQPTALLTGKDLIELGFKPGPEIKKVLSEIRRQQLEETLLTKELALAFAKSQRAH